MPARGRTFLVYLYAGATTSVVGVLQGLQGRPDVARPCRRSNTSQLVVLPQVTDFDEHLRLKTSILEPRADRAGSPFDLGASDGNSAAERRHRAVGVVGLSGAAGVCSFGQTRVCGLAAKAQGARHRV